MRANDGNLGEWIVKAGEYARDLHGHPEDSYKEFYSTELVRNFCRENNIIEIDLGLDTGFVGYINAGKDNCIAFRADLDAVATENGPVHLCGHDYHTATLMGAAGYLSTIREQLPYNVVLIFQPAEETTEGAKLLLTKGLMEKMPGKVVRLFGIHNRPEVECGKVAVHKGPLMSEKADFWVTFKGKPGHGGEPDLCIDPIIPAAQFITGAQSIVSRNLNPLSEAVFGVYTIQSGTDELNPPEEAVIGGTFRALSHEAYERMRERLETLAESTAKAYECESELKIIPLTPLVDNTEKMYEVAYKAALEALGEKNIVDTEPTLASDDFSVLGQEMPAFYYWLGSGEPQKHSPAWHNPEFRIADNYPEYAVKLLVSAALQC